MEHKTKRDLSLINLVNDFEVKFEQGNIDYLDEKTIYQLLEYYENSGMIEKAMEVVEIAIEQYQFRSDFYIIKDRLYFVDRNFDECLSILNYAETIAPFERDIIVLKIKALSCKKQFTEARALLNTLESVVFDSEVADVYISESYIYEYAKQYDQMYSCLKKALIKDPNNNEGLERFWLAVELARKYDDSVAFHKNLIDKNPYNHLAWFNLGLSYSCNWEYDKAIDALEYSFLIEPGFESGYLECAEMCVQQNKIEKALDIYLEANEKFGPESELQVNIASCLLKLNKYEDAKSLLIKSLKHESYNDELYYMLAQCYAVSSNWYNAINAYIKAIELDECREEYYLGLAKAYVEVEDYNKATFNFHKATQICQEESVYWKEYVCFLLKLGLYGEALQILDEAEDFTFGADLLYCRAITYFFLKNKRDGLDMLTEALEEDFHQHHIIFELAPELEVDKDINSMLKYYAKEFSE